MDLGILPLGRKNLLEPNPLKPCQYRKDRTGTHPAYGGRAHGGYVQTPTNIILYKHVRTARLYAYMYIYIYIYIMCVIL